MHRALTDEAVQHVEAQQQLEHALDAALAQADAGAARRAADGDAHVLLARSFEQTIEN